MSDDDIAVPRDAGVPGPKRLTGLVCPACPGALTVHAEGPRKQLVFRCRIGHVYSVPELLGAKEQRVEDRLWAAVVALEELAAALRDLGVDPERMRRAEEDAAAAREIIERTEPTFVEGIADPIPLDGQGDR